MKATLEKTALELLGLSASSRALLAEKLLASLEDEEPSEEAENAWKREALKRYRALKAGKSGGKSRFSCWLTDANFSAISPDLDRHEIQYDAEPDSGGQFITLLLDGKLVEAKSDVFAKLSLLVKESYEKEGE